jgi:hypothetical protein
MNRQRNSSLVDIRKIFDDLFVERVSEKAARAYFDGLSPTAAVSQCEHKKGFVANPALVAAAPQRATPVSREALHHFHPRIRGE